MDYYASKFPNGIYGAVAKLKPGDRAIADVDQKLGSPVKVTCERSELIIDAHLNGGSDVAVELAAWWVRSCGTAAGFIDGSLLSAVMVTGSARYCTVEGIYINNYNTSNTTGHAGIFAYKTSDLVILDCRVTSGNGNGIRLDGVVNADVTGNNVSLTQGSSSEGITLGCQHIRCERNRVDKAKVTGILVWANAYSDINIVGNTVSNSSQSAAGTHPGIGISLNSSSITGLRIDGNTCYDDQATPTQSHAIAIYGPGKISHGRVLGNISYGNQYNDPCTVVYTPDLTEDWIVE